MKYMDVQASRKRFRLPGFEIPARAFRTMLNPCCLRRMTPLTSTSNGQTFLKCPSSSRAASISERTHLSVLLASIKNFVCSRQMRHVVLTVEPVVGHDDRRRQIEHVKLPKRIGERDLVRDVPGLLAESDGLTISTEYSTRSLIVSSPSPSLLNP